MWLLAKDSFVSVVEDQLCPDFMLVRARVRKHLYELQRQTGRKVMNTPDADYPFRITVTRDEFCEWVLRKAEQVGYYNFKNSIKDKRYKAVAERVWYDLIGLEKSNERIHPYLRLVEGELETPGASHGANRKHRHERPSRRKPMLRRV